MSESAAAAVASSRLETDDDIATTEAAGATTATSRKTTSGPLRPRQVAASTGEEESGCHYQQARCNCAGNRRATLNGLIELFEQKLQVGDAANHQNNPNEPPRMSRRRSRRSTRRPEAAMRNIITPVRWRRQGRDDDDDDEANLEATSGGSALERVARKGVPVLPVGGAELRRRLLRPARWASSPAAAGSSSSSESSSGGSCNRGNRLPSATGHLGPKLVRHEASSSRRLLGQLARLRRLREPNYRMRRPEKVAQVERLIEQLERTVASWEEDEQLLDRAERRDLPERYQLAAANREPEEEDEEAEVEEEIEEFGRRTDVEQAEREAIERSHHTTKLGQMSLGRVGGRRRRQLSSRHHSDRYHDDLAVRRLSSSTSHGTKFNTLAARRRPEMSYLLCSGAYTPAMVEPPEVELPQWARHQSHDDLHYRSLTRASRPQVDPEPPFGIPRGHQQPNVNHKRQPEKRSDSRVSFVDSLDSGLAPTTANHSPMSPEAASHPTIKRRSASARLLASQKRQDREDPYEDQDQDEDDHTQEVDLELELGVEGLGLEEPRGESPALERCLAEFRATPTRRRPQIKIENPRAKSPLLRTDGSPVPWASTRATATTRPETPVHIETYERRRKLEQEEECQYQFGEDDGEGDEGRHQQQRPPTTTTVYSESSSSSSSYLNSPGEAAERKEKTKSGALFSIGQYKPLNLPPGGLKIL